jgi:hypothetical protein
MISGLLIYLVFIIISSFSCLLFFQASTSRGSLVALSCYICIYVCIFFYSLDLSFGGRELFLILVVLSWRFYSLGGFIILVLYHLGGFIFLMVLSS